MDSHTQGNVPHREYQWNQPQQQRSDLPKHVPDSLYTGHPILEVSYFKGAHRIVETGARYITINGNFNARPPPHAPEPLGNNPVHSNTPRIFPEMKCSYYENAYDFVLDDPAFLTIEGDVWGPLDPSLFRRNPMPTDTYAPRQTVASTPMPPAYNSYAPPPMGPPRRPPIAPARDYLATNHQPLGGPPPSTMRGPQRQVQNTKRNDQFVRYDGSQKQNTWKPPSGYPQSSEGVKMKAYPKSSV